MSHPEQADIAALLKALTDARIDFVVIGGGAAVLHGAPITTRDLDIVPRRTPENIDRLFTVLEHLDAMVRDPAGRRLRPLRSVLGGTGLACDGTVARIDAAQLPGDRAPTRDRPIAAQLIDRASRHVFSAADPLLRFLDRRQPAVLKRVSPELLRMPESMLRPVNIDTATVVQPAP